VACYLSVTKCMTAKEYRGGSVVASVLAENDGKSKILD
jgi:hypothetical protein